MTTMNQANWSIRSGITAKALEREDVWWLTSWLLTFLRFPLMLACLYLILHNAHFSLIWGVVSAIVISDIFDGELFALSKRSGKPKIFRHIIDAIGDRVVMYSILLVARPIYNIDTGVYLLIFFRELVLTAVVLKPLVKEKIVIKANYFSKVGTACIALIGMNYIKTLLPMNILVVTFVVFSSWGIYHYLFHYEKEQ